MKAPAPQQLAHLYEQKPTPLKASKKSLNPTGCIRRYYLGRYRPNSIDDYSPIALRRRRFDAVLNAKSNSSF